MSQEIGQDASCIPYELMLDSDGAAIDTWKDGRGDDVVGGDPANRRLY